MNKKIIGAVIAAVVLIVAFAACSDEPQEVNVVDYDYQGNAKQVAAVNVAQVDSNYNLILTWEAAQDGTGYDVYCQKEGTKTVKQLNGMGPTNEGSFSANTPAVNQKGPAGLKWTDNKTNPDNWTFAIAVQYTETTTYGTGVGAISNSQLRGNLPPGSYRFGIRTYDAINRHSPSDIKWTTYTPVAAPADVTNTIP